MVWYVDPGRLAQQMKSVNVGLFVLATLVSIVANFFSAARWRVIARAMGLQAPGAATTTMYFRGVTMNVLLPGATVSGDLLRSYQLSAIGGNTLLRSGVSVLLDRLSGLWTLCALSLASLLAAAAAGMLGAMTREALAVYVLLLGAAVAAPWIPIPFFAKIEAQRRQALEGGGPLLRAAWLSVLVQLASSTSLWLCGLATGVDLSYPLMLAAAAPVFIMASLPLGWAGFGTRELAAVVVLGLLGVPADQATATALLYGLSAVVQGALAAPLFLAKL